MFPYWYARCCGLRACSGSSMRVDSMLMECPASHSESKTRMSDARGLLVIRKPWEWLVLAVHLLSLHQLSCERFVASLWAVSSFVELG